VLAKSHDMFYFFVDSFVLFGVGPGPSHTRYFSVDRCDEIDWFSVSVPIFRRIYALTSESFALR